MATANAAATTTPVTLTETVGGIAATMDLIISRGKDRDVDLISVKIKLPTNVSSENPV